MWRKPMPIVRHSRKYRAIIGRRCEAYAPLTSGYNGLVGGSNPLGSTTQSCATGDFLKVYERPRIGGDVCDGSFAETTAPRRAPPSDSHHTSRLRPDGSLCPP